MADKQKPEVKKDAGKKQIVRRTVGEKINERSYLSIHFYAPELTEFVSKGILKTEFKVKDVHDLVLAKFGITSKTKGQGSAVKMLREKTKLTQSELARKVLSNPELLKAVIK